VARRLNGSGITTQRGKAFDPRTVQRIVESPVYVGEHGYPAIVSSELKERALQAMKRRDPVAEHRRQGGRRPREDWTLRGICFCAGCGSGLYTSRNYLRGQRAYVCRHRVACTGLCDRQPIPAELLERHVLNHLGSFIGSVEGWVTDQLKEREHERHHCERLLDEERAGLRDLDAQRDQRMGEIARLDLSRSRGQIAMELIERIDAQRVAQEQRIIEAEAVLSEWATTPCVDEALDFYNALVDQIDGRVKQASGVRELNEALAGILAGMWCEMEPERERLLV
jgi:hypothetical protein